MNMGIMGMRAGMGMKMGVSLCEIFVLGRHSVSFLFPFDRDDDILRFFTIMSYEYRYNRGGSRKYVPKSKWRTNESLPPSCKQG